MKSVAIEEVNSIARLMQEENFRLKCADSLLKVSNKELIALINSKMAMAKATLVHA